MIKILAVDFDGTLCVDNFPGIGTPLEETISLVKAYKAMGYTIILWTCRCGKYLEEALFFCAHWGIPIDHINENAPETIERFGDDPRKIFADIYIDDRMVAIPHTLASLTERVEVLERANEQQYYYQLEHNEKD